MDIVEQVEKLERDLAARKKRQVEVAAEVKSLGWKYRVAAGEVVGHAKPLSSARELKDQIENAQVELDGLAELAEKLEAELKEKRPLAEAERKRRREARDAENYHAAEVKGRALLAEVERACAGLATALRVLDGFDPGFGREAIKTGVEAAAVATIYAVLGIKRGEAVARSWVKFAAQGQAFTQLLPR
jgi:hypothetical protein